MNESKKYSLIDKVNSSTHCKFLLYSYIAVCIPITAVFIFLATNLMNSNFLVGINLFFVALIIVSFMCVNFYFKNGTRIRAKIKAEVKPLSESLLCEINYIINDQELSKTKSIDTNMIRADQTLDIIVHPTKPHKFITPPRKESHIDKLVENKKTESFNQRNNIEIQLDLKQSIFFTIMLGVGMWIIIMITTSMTAEESSLVNEHFSYTKSPYRKDISPLAHKVCTFVKGSPFFYFMIWCLITSILVIVKKMYPQKNIFELFNFFVLILFILGLVQYLLITSVIL